ncbi:MULTISPECIES: protease inhibitor I42 family protein [unclassified Legionella]|uniref:protease inhibitor I42 family protein n=1 Tax=unclassified Legionella TaxID=2622702 RepID=UPI0010541EEC|nr:MULTISPECIES: protease inhibitor I42 family protein [unclassified Legionella]MDI9818289.1 protease inhibitor I42 family protein [Legionella sp. PL877]
MRILFGGLLLAFMTFANAADTMIINVDANQPHFIITLPSNPTTGYQWIVKDYDQSFLRLLSSRYVAPQNKLIGAGGNMIFTFELIKGKTYPQNTKMTFKYVRPWESDNGTLQKISINFKS